MSIQLIIRALAFLKSELRVFFDIFLYLKIVEYRILTVYVRVSSYSLSKAWSVCKIMSSTCTGTSSGQSGHGGPHRTANFPYCPEIGKYEKMAKVGQGTFG